MKVSELLLLLANYDPETEIYISSDSEGNSYKKIRYETPGIFVGGDFYFLNYSGDDSDFSTEEWEDLKNTNTEVLCLWP